MLISLSTQIVGQDVYEKYNIKRSKIKIFLNKFSITATTGVSVANYSHQLSGAHFYQDKENNQFIFSNDINDKKTSFSGYTNWLDNPQVGFQTSLDKLSNQGFLIDTDTANLDFVGKSLGVPITLSVHYDYKKIRIGLGYSYEMYFLSKLSPTLYTEQVVDYQMDNTKIKYSKLFLNLGYQIYSFWDYDFVADIQIGKINSVKQPNQNEISRSLYTNVGLSIENNWSEYFRVIIRPSLEFKSYTTTIPDGAMINSNYPAFSIQVGISINIPEIPRSPMKNDHIQLKHVYTDPSTGDKMEVRGQPMWKIQNPKVGEGYRKPNHLKNKSN